MKVLGMNEPNTYTPLSCEQLERIAHYLMSQQLDAGEEFARDTLVDELLRKQGIDPKNVEAQTKEIANQAVMKIIMPCNFSEKSRPIEEFWRRS
jgi:hypothetical protein